MNIEEISFGIISYAGDALGSMREAIKCAREKNFENAENLMKEATNSLKEAHDVHTKILMEEANGNKTEYSILLSHAQDTMMNAMTFQAVAEEFITMYKEK